MLPAAAGTCNPLIAFLGRAQTHSLAVPKRRAPPRLSGDQRSLVRQSGSGSPNRAAPLPHAMRRAAAGGRSPSQRRASAISAS